MRYNRHTSKKKGAKKNKYSNKYNKFPLKRKILLFFSSIKTNSIIINMLSRLLYFFLIFAFSIIDIFIMVIILGTGNLNFFKIIIILVSFCINLILFAEIISLRSNWKTIFFEYSHTLSLTQILKHKFFVIESTLFNSIFVLIILSQNAKNAVNYPQWTNFYIAVSIICIILLFELQFWFKLSNDQIIFSIFKNNKNAKNDAVDKLMENRLLSPSPATFKVTNSKIVLIGILIVSIFCAMIISEQIDYFFLDPTSFNLNFLFFGLFFTIIFYIYFIISSNTILLKLFKLDRNLDIKSNIHIMLCSVFIFINAVYFSKYLAIAFLYYPMEYNNSVSNMMLESMANTGIYPYQNPNIIVLGKSIYYLIFSLVSAILAYFIYLALTFRRDIAKVQENMNTILSKNNNESVSFKNPISKAIVKLFSKRLSDHQFVKNFSIFYYINVLVAPSLISFYTLFLLIKDSYFGTREFCYSITEPQYELIAYFFFIFVVGDIHEYTKKYYKYPLRHFISKNTWKKYVKYSSIEYSIFAGYLIDIIMREVYRISMEYGNITAPESIQTLQHLLISFIVLGYLFSSLSSKVEDFFIKAYDNDF